MRNSLRLTYLKQYVKIIISRIEVNNNINYEKGVEK